MINESQTQRRNGRRVLAMLGWSLALGVCVLPWTAAAPRLVRGLQAWRTGGPAALVVYPPSQYRGTATGGWSESARQAVLGGAGWAAIGVVLTGGLLAAFLIQRRHNSSDSPP
ncbi:MAG: hypothetical protein U0939_12345 [Pirellulales bacterium]